MKTAAVCLTFSLFLNTLLLFLLEKSKKIIGSYRYLLVVYSCFLISHNFVDFLMLPAVHIHKSGFIYFATSALKQRPFGMVLAGLRRDGYGKYWYIWPVVSAVLMSIWALAVIFLALPCDLFDWHFRDSVVIKYGIDILETSYYAVAYILENTISGKEEYYLPRVFCLGLVAVCQAVSGFLSVVCGYYLYKSIKDASNFTSGIMAKVHKDLFWVLVLQVIYLRVKLHNPNISDNNPLLHDLFSRIYYNFCTTPEYWCECDKH
ncbi:hypothetical protein CRE_27546 [Caenorhabditis remanei]|uniref:Uncharacterized protein n=1 Tax=Caenorhabditis remanei TaxID=31234 RepID=E3LP81_CAERE|nr:hypothetical protein CRE_27546 [Caenorhabditis remanei]